MPGLHVVLDGSDPPWLDGKEVVEADPDTLTILGLPVGMVSGKPSVGITAQLPDGKWVLIQTSLELFQGANAALRGRFGEIMGDEE